MEDVFIGSEAVARGSLTKSDLRRHRAIFRDVYVPKLHEPSLRDRTAGSGRGHVGARSSREWPHQRCTVHGGWTPTFPLS